MGSIVDFEIEELLSSHSVNPRIISTKAYETLKNVMIMYYLHQRPPPQNLQVFLARGVIPSKRRPMQAPRRHIRESPSHLVGQSGYKATTTSDHAAATVD
ncbi:hypothetical protein K435DRAFT_863855 [Dendrothele bispora CBS 962.96]|uniref:Uncharacterized protein n=1 Tax=Dendrothele bispora (strain CBS 962.96) TaxID=1314807 RepID=A0A4S8LP50_DENBC|nr:hypothetical protein K435DRAFT_968413 [Dendrothele bispora CBS 962.96]THU90941.1 hypothetical protein K435DRAFT_863855 [Dendrothele bispora CBS 962.96]